MIYQKHQLRWDHSVAISQRSGQFHNGVVYIFCVMYSLIIHFGINKYELSWTIYIGLLHMYHLSVLPPKQHNIPLIVSSQISIPNVSPNLTDTHGPYSRRGHDEQKARLGWQIYRKCARQLLNVPVT